MSYDNNYQQNNAYGGNNNYQQQNGVNNTNYQNNDKVTVTEQVCRKAFYTKSSMFTCEIKPQSDKDREVIFLTIMPSIGDKKYDFKSMIKVRMNLDEMSLISASMERYFVNVDAFLEFSNRVMPSRDGKPTDGISFFHKSGNNNKIIKLGLNQYGGLQLIITVMEQGKENRTLTFPFLPTTMFYIKNVIDNYIAKLLQTEETISYQTYRK